MPARRGHKRKRPTDAVKVDGLRLCRAYAARCARDPLYLEHRKKIAAVVRDVVRMKRRKRITRGLKG